MNILDITILAILAIGVCKGWHDGFIKSLCSFAGFAVGLFLAATFYNIVGERLAPHLGESAQAAPILAFIMIQTGLIRFSISKIVFLLPGKNLDERVDLEYRRLVGRRVADVAYLQIAVARLRTGGAYAHREEALLFRGMAHRLQHIVAECSLVGDELVGGCDYKRGGGVDVLDAVGSPCRNGSGVATDRLDEQTTRRKLGQLSSGH